METLSETLSNGKTIDYKIVNGTAYHLETNDQVVTILERERQRNTRLTICYGDVETGRDWEEHYDVNGYIGRSTGSIKIPLLIANSRSSGGGALLTHCIVKIMTSRYKTTLYQHPTYYKETK